jgi:peptidoglycan/LPS O-acetylase OafA/YrhL
MRNPGDALIRPGIFRLFLAIAVILQHAGVSALGAWAVDVFFVLSGYWVCRMWQEKYRMRPHAVLTFFGSRFWRLWPTFVVCNLIALAVFARFSPCWGAEAAIMSHPTWIARTLAIVSSGSQFDLVPPMWSLDIEMQFYLLLPLLAWLVARIFGLPAVWRQILLIAAFGGLAAFFVQQPPIEGHLRLLPNFLGFFLLGMIAFFSGWAPSRRIGLGSAALVAGVLLVMMCAPYWRTLLSPEAARTSQVALHIRNTVFCGALAVLAAPYALFTATQPSPTLDRHFGNISYVVYLFHFPVQQFMEWGGHAVSSSPLVRGVFQLTVLIVGTLVIYRYVDLPSEHWRHALFEKRRGLPQP